MASPKTCPAYRVAQTGHCPVCDVIFEACRCNGGFRQTVLTPRAGVAEEIGRQDDQSGDDGRGYERDETERFHQIVRHLMDDGDQRANAAGRRARRTLAQMAPGTTQQPVLLMTRPLTFTPIAPTAPAGPVAGRPCTSCQGAGGRTVDTSSDGVSRQHWQSCTPCGGSGEAR
ncbi:hypothetical protein [Streptomyces microflavus]|uniref:hypothetical protein n=1 Tax=Streptomyces microflavus TaxID=1919 RepID=UPI00364E24F2